MAVRPVTERPLLVSELRRQRASETHRKYPYWWNGREWAPATSLPGWNSVQNLQRSIWRPTRLDPTYRVPTAWNGPRAVYNVARFVDAFLPPAPDEDHRLTFRWDDGKPRLHWRGVRLDHLHRRPWRTFLCCNGFTDEQSRPRPVVWQEADFPLPEGDPWSYVWNPLAAVGHPAHMSEPSSLPRPDGQDYPKAGTPSLLELMGVPAPPSDESMTRSAQRTGAWSLTEDDVLTEEAPWHSRWWKRWEAPDLCLCDPRWPSPQCWVAHEQN